MTGPTRSTSGQPVDARFAEYQATGDRRIRDALLEEHRGLSRHLARRFAHRGEPLDELDQVALVGLLKAIERFDPAHGVQFSTFAVPTIVGELKRHFRDRGWAVRVPRRVQELHLEIARVVGELGQELHRSPTPAEVAVRAETTEDDVLEALEAGDLYQLASLDEPSFDGPVREPADEANEFDVLEHRLVIEELLETLPARERAIVEMRFFQGLTQSEIAARVGISQMHVSRLLTQSLTALREHAVSS